MKIFEDLRRLGDTPCFAVSPNFGRGIFGEVHWYPSIFGRVCTFTSKYVEERDPRERERERVASRATQQTIARFGDDARVVNTE